MEGNWSNVTGTEDGSPGNGDPSYSAFSILLLVFIIILANIVLMVGIRRSRQCQRLFYTMLVSLATVDIMWACLVLTLPAFLLVYGDFWLVTGICAVWHVLEPLLQAVSLLHVVVLAYNSHMALVHPLRYRVASEGCRWLVLQETIVWLGACVLLVPMIVVLLLAGGVSEVQWARNCRAGVEREVAVTRAVCVVVACIGAGVACVLSGIATRRHKHVLHAVCSIMQRDPASSTVICNGKQIIRNITRLHAVAATFKARPLKQALSNGSIMSGKDSIGSAHSIEAMATDMMENDTRKEIDSQSVCRSISTNSSCSTFPIEPSAHQDPLPEGVSPSGSQDGIVMKLDSNKTQNNGDATIQQATTQEHLNTNHKEEDKEHDNYEDQNGTNIENIHNQDKSDDEEHDASNQNGYLCAEQAENPNSPDTAQSPLDDAQPFSKNSDMTITEKAEQADTNDDKTSDQPNNEDNLSKNEEETNADDSAAPIADDTENLTTDEKKEPSASQVEDYDPVEHEQQKSHEGKPDHVDINDSTPAHNEPIVESSLQEPPNSDDDLPDPPGKDNTASCIENTSSHETDGQNLERENAGASSENIPSQDAGDLTPSSQASKPPPFSRVSRESLNQPVEDKDIDLIIGNGVLNPCFVTGDEEEGISLADAIQVHSPSIRSTVDDNQERPYVEKDQSIDSLDTDAAECGIRPGRRSILKRDNHRSLRKSVKFASDVNETAGAKKLVRKGTKHVKVTHSQSNGLQPTATMTFSTLSLQKSLSVTPESQSSLDYLSKVNSVQGERATNRLRNEELTIWVVCALVILLVVLYLPYTIAFTLNAFSADPHKESLALSVLQWISYCSGLVLPAVILVLSKEIRGHMSAACCCIPAKYSEESQETPNPPGAIHGSEKPLVDEEAVVATAQNDELMSAGYQQNHDQHTVLDNNLLVASLQSAIDRLNAEKNENDDDSSSVSTTAMVHNDAALDDLYFDDGSEQLDATEMTGLQTDQDGSLQNFLDTESLENNAHDHGISMEHRTGMNGQAK